MISVPVEGAKAAAQEHGEGASERTCETCRYVQQRAGNTWADQRCSLYRAGRNHVMTWTATRNPKKCGMDRVNWARKLTEDEMAQANEEKARILAAGGPRAALLSLICRSGDDGERATDE